LDAVRSPEVLDRRDPVRDVDHGVTARDGAREELDPALRRAAEKRAPRQVVDALELLRDLDFQVGHAGSLLRTVQARNARPALPEGGYHRPSMPNPFDVRFERSPVAEGVALHMRRDPKFKTAIVKLFLRTDLDEARATEIALLPSV